MVVCLYCLNFFTGEGSNSTGWAVVAAVTEGCWRTMRRHPPSAGHPFIKQAAAPALTGGGAPAKEASMATSFRDDLVTMIPHLRAFARSLTGSVDLADDLVQETVMRALRAQNQYQPQTKRKAWPFTIFGNQHITTMRLATLSQPEDRRVGD